MRILVTGGAGYIGSITTRLLLDAGHECVVLDTLENGHREAVDPRATLQVGNVGDAGLLDRILPACDAVMHLAGYIEVAESQADPGRYFTNNVSRALVMLDAMVRNGVRDIVFSSTAAVYGEPDIVPIVEDSPTRPVNAYGASKLMFEEALDWYERAHDLRSIRLRYFNVAGAFGDGVLGEAHDPESHLIPRILQAMARGDAHFDVYGGDYDTIDGTCIRDYIHVSDLGEAHRLALERLHSGEAGGVFNLGNGRGFSNLEVVRACAEVTGRQVDIEIGPRRAGDPPQLVASHGRAHRELGWTPARPSLEEIVGDAWRWHTAHPEGYGA